MEKIDSLNAREKKWYEGLPGDFWKMEAEYMMEFKDLHRDWPLYSAYCNLERDDLVGKKILDIGAGAAEFAKDAKDMGIDVTVVDPIYFSASGRKLLKKEKLGKEIKNFFLNKPKETPGAVAAFGQDLPFRDKNFDVVSSVYSSFYYAKSPEDIIKNLDEGLRVLKPGGKMVVFPLLGERLNPEEDKTEPKLMGHYPGNKERSHVFWQHIDKLKSRGDIEIVLGGPRLSRGHDQDEMRSGDRYFCQRFLQITKKIKLYDSVENKQDERAEEKEAA
ncbi:hypothetical protein A2468_05195 [Candidatus Falkowbacteria bacterium RIFOXYC2_FULL_46_15]|nr:MAG: hypothetical protein A2468_05195 [Candidatus Falkowbacteria bacterium RIFOXYC2_FULL_46_15]